MAAPKRRTPAKSRRARANAAPARAKRARQGQKAAKPRARKAAPPSRRRIKAAARPARRGPVARKPVPAKSTRRAPAKPRRIAKKRPAPRTKPAKAPQAAKRVRPPATPVAATRKAAKPRPPVAPPNAMTSQRAAHRPALDRARRQLPPDDAEVAVGTEADERLISAVRTGREELKQLLSKHTETSPALTAGDVDANWGDAYAVGDEAPGGDNPTPDQDVVDEIGGALGVSYAADEELLGSDKIVERDKHRWELDPASSDDWPHDES